MPYSVSPRRKLTIVGLNPSWNLRTRMPTRLAARKCPSSCTKTSTPSTNAKESNVINKKTSDPQFYLDLAGDLPRILASPLVCRPDGAKSGHFCRPMHIHGPLDDSGDRSEREPAFEKTRDGDLVRGVEYDG